MDDAVVLVSWHFAEFSSDAHERRARAGERFQRRPLRCGLMLST